jgi:hypothetical protein
MVCPAFTQLRLPCGSWDIRFVLDRYRVGIGMMIAFFLAIA